MAGVQRERSQHGRGQCVVLAVDCSGGLRQGFLQQHCTASQHKLCCGASRKGHMIQKTVKVFGSPQALGMRVSQSLRATENLHRQALQSTRATHDEHLHTAKATYNEQLQIAQAALDEQLQSVHAMHDEQLRTAQATPNEQLQTAQPTHNKELQQAVDAARARCSVAKGMLH